MLETLLLALALAANSADVSSLQATAKMTCAQASKDSSKLHGRLPIEKFDECIVEEANKKPLPLRKAICALGRSGGKYGSPVEVYMANGRCRTDYE